MSNWLNKFFKKSVTIVVEVVEKKVVAKCGHETKLKDEVVAFGETTITMIKSHEDGTVDYCHKCLEKMAIQCAWCGKPIFIGDLITLYSPAGKFEVPNYAVKYNENPLQFVGCPRSNCADTGADYFGRWLPPGKVSRFSSLIEKSFADMAKGGNGVICCNDLSKL